MPDEFTGYAAEATEEQLERLIALTEDGKAHNWEWLLEWIKGKRGTIGSPNRFDVIHPATAEHVLNYFERSGDYLS